MKSLDEGLKMDLSSPARRDSPTGLSMRELFRPLKELNAKMAALKYLVQDYSFETMPQWLSFATTTICNLKCPHCQTHGTEEVDRAYNSKSKRWPEETLRRLARETLPSAYEFNLTLSGEPLTLPHLKERLDELGQYGAKLDLNTNGTLFTKKMLIKVLPIVGTLSVSIDGATELTCEAIRLGVKFKQLLTNIRVVTRTCELLSGVVSPDIKFAFTLMGSNIKDMPEIVRLAHVLRVPTVVFHPVVVLFPHVRNEDLNLHQPLYNAYYDRAQQESGRLGVRLEGMPPPFPGVTADASAPVGGAGMIVKQLPDDYYETLPPPESFLDHDDIESRAVEIAAGISEERQASEVETTAGTVLIEELQILMRDRFAALLDLHKLEFERLAGSGEEKINYCENLFNRTFVTTGGDVIPCCMQNTPILGNIHQNTMREIWNGDLYNDFRRQFFSSNVPGCCKGCRFLVSRSKQDLLYQISPA